MFEINSKIKSEDKDKWIFEVVVAEDDNETTYVVEFNKIDYKRLAKTKTTPEELINKSFEFLLSREPKESILSNFNLMEISQYFPEYEKEIISMCEEQQQ